MSLEERVNQSIKEAMKSKDKDALDALRAVKSQLLLLKTESKDAKVEVQQEIALIQKLIKQRNEAAEQFRANAREELAEKEETQIKYLEPFLPQQLSAEELESKLKELISELQAESMKDMGKVMNKANEVLMGKADGKSISTKVKELLS